MRQVLFDQTVQTDYGQLELTWRPSDSLVTGDFEPLFAGQLNGLVGAADSRGIYVNLARRSGGSPLQVVLLSEEPAEPDSVWEDVVEVSATVPRDAAARWETWAAESSGPLIGLQPGEYRVRVCAVGRDAGHLDEDAEGPVDRHLIEFWPAVPTADAVLRVGSDNARYWHREWGARR